jgi:hypothetical protein
LIRLISIAHYIVSGRFEFKILDLSKDLFLAVNCGFGALKMMRFCGAPICYISYYERRFIDGRTVSADASGRVASSGFIARLCRAYGTNSERGSDHDRHLAARRRRV